MPSLLWPESPCLFISNFGVAASIQKCSLWQGAIRETTRFCRCFCKQGFGYQSWQVSKLMILILNWLRVFRSAEAARIGPGVWQQRQTRAVRSEKCVRLRGRAWAGMRVIAVFFDPCAPDVLTAHRSVFSHNFKRLDRFTKLATSSGCAALRGRPCAR